MLHNDDAGKMVLQVTDKQDNGLHLSPWQYSLLGDQTAPPASKDNRRWLILLKRDKVDAYYKALRTLLERHKIFSARFSSVGADWYRTTVPEVLDNMVSVQDAGDLDDVEFNTFATKLAAEIERRMDVSKPNLAKFILFHGRNLSGVRMLVVINHLLFDWISFNLLLHELEQENVSRSGIPSETTGGFDEWTESLENYRQGAFQQDAKLWLNRQWEEVGLVPLAGGPSNAKLGWATVFTQNIHISKDDLNRITSTARIHPVDLIVAAIAEVTRKTTGAGYTSVALMEHGRSPMCYLSAIGVFTYWWPVLVKNSSSMQELLHLVHERRLSELPKYGYMLGRYGNGEVESRRAFQLIEKPQIHLNFTGDFGSEAGESERRRFIPSVEPLDLSKLRDIVLYVSCPSSRMKFRWDYSAAMYSKEDMDNLAQVFGETLSALVEICRNQGA